MLEQQVYLEMMQIPSCSSPQPSLSSSFDSSSSDFDFDLDLLVSDYQAPSLELPIPDNTSHFDRSCINFISSKTYHQQVPSPTNTLSPLEINVNSPTMFSPVDPYQQKGSPAPHGIKQEGVRQYAPLASPISVPACSPYSPACRPSRHHSTDSIKTSISSMSGSANQSFDLQESLAEFNTLQSKIYEQQTASPPPPYSPVTCGVMTSSSTTTQATVQIKIEPMEHIMSPGSSAIDPELQSALASRGYESKYDPKPFDFGVSTGYATSSSLIHHSGGNVSNVQRRDPPDYAKAIRDKAMSQLQQSEEDPVLSLALAQVNSDIAKACQTLNILSNPSLWSGNDICKWLRFTCQQYNINISNPEREAVLQQFANLSGQKFVQLSEPDFRQYFGQEGELLHAQLDLWRSTTGLHSSNPIKSETPDQPQASTSRHKPVQKEDSLDINYVLQMLESKAENTAAAAAAAATAVDTSSFSHQEQKPVVKTQSEQPPPPYQCFDQAQQQEQQQQPTPLSEAEAMQEDMDEDTDSPVSGPSSSSSHSSQRPPTAGRSSSNIHLWQFVKELLNEPHKHSGCIHWIDKEKGIFKIVDSNRVATLWGQRKNRPAMNYDKLSRSLRQYYRKGIMKKTERTQRLVYQFCSPYHHN